MPRIRAVLAVAVLCTGLPAAATLQMPAEEPAQETAPSEGTMPPRGITMEEVETRFGSPTEKLPAVGDPPITRWVYADYIVYFEGRYVIHTVSTKRP